VNYRIKDLELNNANPDGRLVDKWLIDFIETLSFVILYGFGLSTALWCFGVDWSFKLLFGSGLGFWFLIRLLKLIFLKKEYF